MDNNQIIEINNAESEDTSVSENNILDTTKQIDENILDKIKNEMLGEKKKENHKNNINMNTSTILFDIENQLRKFRAIKIKRLCSGEIVNKKTYSAYSLFKKIEPLDNKEDVETNIDTIYRPVIPQGTVDYVLKK
jgi:hypothetical protein